MSNLEEHKDRLFTLDELLEVVEAALVFGRCEGMIAAVEEEGAADLPAERLFNMLDFPAES